MFRFCMVCPRLLVYAAIAASSFGGLFAQPMVAQPPQTSYRASQSYRYGYNPGYYAQSGAGILATPKRGGARVSPASVLRTPARPAQPEPPATFATDGLTVTVAHPSSPPVYVDIRGPNNEVRTFRLRGGLESIQVQKFTVRPGERLVIALPVITVVPAPRK